MTPEENLKEGCELKCPKCSEWNSHDKWEETIVYCEDCGEHAAIQCPHCDEEFDHVGSEPFQCRIPNDLKNK